MIWYLVSVPTPSRERENRKFFRFFVFYFKLRKKERKWINKFKKQMNTMYRLNLIIQQASEFSFFRWINNIIWKITFMRVCMWVIYFWMTFQDLVPFFSRCRKMDLCSRVILSLLCNYSKNLNDFFRFKLNRQIWIGSLNRAGPAHCQTAATKQKFKSKQTSQQRNVIKFHTSHGILRDLFTVSRRWAGLP